VALRTGEPDRAAALVEVLAPWPPYKTGQFLFDLMEWEDFMVDGPPPPVLSTTLDVAALQRLLVLLRRVQGLLDGAKGDDPLGPLRGLDVTSPGVSVAADDSTLPPLEPGFYLYRDVVLGFVVSVGPLLAAQDDGSPT
jgi:hypothetical protein